MPEETDDLVQRVQDSFRQIPVIASSLNLVSDKLNTSVNRLEAVLKKHPISVTSWVTFARWESPDGMFYRNNQVGFTRTNGKWGLAIRVAVGDRINGEDRNQTEQWIFNEAPRAFRVKAVSKLPDVLEQLIKDGTEMIAEVTEQAKAVDFLAAALESVTDIGPVERHQQARKAAKQDGEVKK